MDYLVQNTTQAPIFLHVVRNRDGKPSPEGTIVFEGNNSVTKVSEDIYENFLIRNAFYRQRIEQGHLIILNNSTENLDEKVQAGVRAQELGYAKYVSLVEKIAASGGLAEPRLRQWLDSDGMPLLELCRKNLGPDVDPQTLDAYRNRYMIEKSNGLHKGELILPVGTMQSAAVKANVVEEAETAKNGPSVAEEGKDPDLEAMTIEQLKSYADEHNVQYNEDISFQRLVMRVKKAIGK